MVTIEADEEVWRFLQVRKNPGESNNDVLRRELGFDDGDEPEPEPEPEPTRDDASDLDELLYDWQPDTEVDIKRARTELTRVYEWLSEQRDPMTKSEIIDACAGESEWSERSWWERAVRPGLRELVDHDLVEYRAGYHDYAVKP